MYTYLKNLELQNCELHVLITMSENNFKIYFKLPYYQNLKAIAFILIVKMNSVFLPLRFKGISDCLFGRLIQIEI